MENIRGKSETQLLEAFHASTDTELRSQVLGELTRRRENRIELAK